MWKGLLAGAQATVLAAVLLLAGGCRPAPVNASPGELGRGRELAAGVLLDGRTQHVQILAGDDTGRTQVVADFAGQQPLWSPDGAMLAFAKLGSDGVQQIWVAGPHGGHQRQLTKSDSAVRPESWSPSGDKIYYTDHSNPEQVWAVDVRSGRAGHLANAPVDERRPKASPDGKYIAFFRGRSDEESSQMDIWVMKPDGSDAHRITSPPNFPGLFTWSADGKWLYYGSSDGTNARGLAHFAEMLANPPAEAKSPQGAVALLRKWGVMLSIWRVRPDGSSRTMVIKGAPATTMGTCSPKGDLIAYLAVGAQGKTEVRVAKADGSEPRSVSHPAKDYGMPRWSPDGRILAWSQPRPGGGIEGYDLSSGKQRIIAANTKQVAYVSAHWRPKAPDKPKSGSARDTQG